MFADVAVREADIRLGGRQPVQQSRARISRVLFALGAALTAIALTASLASAAQPRSYYQLAVIINDSRSPVVAFTFWLDSPFNSTSDNSTMAKTIDISVAFGPELALDGRVNATWTNHSENVIGDQSFSVNTTIVQSSSSSVFTTVAVTVVYTDMDGARPRTIFRSLTFALFPVSTPEPPVNLVAAAAAGLGSAGVLGLGLYVIRRARLEELYLMHDSGMLIRHWSRAEGMVHDSDIMSGMFIVLQEFVRDSFDDRRGTLEQLRFGQRQVLMVRGHHSVLAAVIQGRYLNGLPRKLQLAVWEFEQSHAAILETWDGNIALLPYADAIAQRFLRPRLRLHPN